MFPESMFKSDQMVIAKRENTSITVIILGKHFNVNHWEYLVYSAEDPHQTFVFSEGNVRHLRKEDIN